jgi:hypothetical protein
MDNSGNGRELKRDYAKEELLGKGEKRSCRNSELR